MNEDGVTEKGTCGTHRTEELICIVCPIGCTLRVEHDGTSIISIEGHTCKRGVDYAEKELFNPTRTLTSSILVRNGELPLASVRTTGQIPKPMVWDIMEKIKEVVVEAPVELGQVVLEDVDGCGNDVVVTRAVGREVQ